MTPIFCLEFDNAGDSVGNGTFSGKWEVVVADHSLEKDEGNTWTSLAMMPVLADPAA
jgi:hypothetical protein